VSEFEHLAFERGTKFERESHFESAFPKWTAERINVHSQPDGYGIGHYALDQERGDQRTLNPKLNPKSTDTVTDELNDVLGRFVAWTASQRSATKAQHTQASYPGARELSYEEALRANRFRSRHSESEAAPLDEPAATPAVGPLTSVNARSEAELPAQDAPSDRTPSPVSPRRRGSKRSKPAAESPTPVTRLKTTRNPAEKPRKPRRADHAPKDVPEFREVLGASLSNTSSAAVNPDKSVWLTLRVTTSEQSLIQARAAEAELSVSAYLRQCAFEVETLREQVQRALLDMRPSVAALPTPQAESAPPALPGVFTGLAQRVARLFGRTPRFSASA
jgi:hypothetical protein